MHTYTITQTHTGTRLYQGVANREVPNYTMLAARDIQQDDVGAPGGLGANDGINDGLWCQSAQVSESIGLWTGPDGIAISTDDEATSIHAVYATGQVGLLRDATLKGSEGMYVCTIPDENGTSQTLVMWAAGNNVYDGVSGKREFNSLRSITKMQLLV